MITRKGYELKKNDLDENTLKSIRSDLTVEPFTMGSYGYNKKDKKFPIFEEDETTIYVPKYYGIEKFGQPQVNILETYKYPKYKMQYNGLLRPKQEVIVQKVFQGFEQQRGGLLIAGCGSGKTNMAIYIACHYKLKTLIIVHKEFLRNQARERILSTTNIKKVGIIQRNKVDVDAPIVIAMVHSLIKRDYDPQIFKNFGLVIIDEVHHMGAKNFSRAFQKVGAKYMLGISAERKRNDGMFCIINWHMGPILHMEEQAPNNMVVVKRYHYKTSNKERSKELFIRYTGDPDRATMINNLICIKYRNRLIIKLIEELFDQGKNVLCLTGRLKQIELFQILLEQNAYTKGNVGTYIGGMSEAELAVSATKQIILGTYSMAEEGLDIPNLNAIIMCTPKSAVKQSIGRILRKEVYEEHPIVIDLIDSDNSIFRRQADRRLMYYKKQHYNIQDFKVSDYVLEGHSMWNDCRFIQESLTKVPAPTYITKLITEKIAPIDNMLLDFSD